MLAAVEIKNRLAEWMKEKGWTQAKTSEMTGLDVSTVRRIQKNQGDPSRAAFAAICDAFEKPVSEFFYEEDE